MALFVVRHQHDPERCPATDPYAGTMVLNYLSRSNVRQQGVKIHGEAVAGNGRSLLNPPVEGEKWGLGAVSTAEWTGVPLVEVLDRAGIRAGAQEVLFRGADGGRIDGRNDVARFERSLKLDAARDSEALLAYAMNGKPLPIQHGHPLRLIVPGWYAVASVKWLAEIEVIGDAFRGYYQDHKYLYEWERDGGAAREPVTLQRVRALITEPTPGPGHRPWRCDHPGGGVVGSGPHCSRGGERGWWPLA